MRRFVAVCAISVVATLGLAPASGGAQAPATGDVTVVHGLRGLLADLYLDGAIVLPRFEPERVTDPLPIPAGPHRVEVREAGADPASSPALTGTIDVVAGANLSAVAHLSEAGAPALTTFTNDVRPVPAGSTRLALRHVAGAAPVDIGVDGRRLAAALGNPRELVTEVGASVHSVTVDEPGRSEPVVPPTDVPVVEGTVQALYLIGSAADGSVGWITQTVALAATAPSGVATGDSGLAVPAGAGPLPVGVAVAVVLAVALTGALLLATRPGRHARL